MSKIEVEVKLPFEDPASACLAIERAGGVETRSRHFEENRLFDTPAGDLARREAILRVRSTSDGAGLLTYKEKVHSDSRAKVRGEWETPVQDPEMLRKILEKVGFVTIYRYQKYRTVFRLGGAVADLDETPIGCFVEVEAPADQLPRIAATLGKTEEEMIAEDYRALHLRDLERRGLSREDMIFRDAPAT